MPELPEPTTIGVPMHRDSAVVVHVTSRRWLSFSISPLRAP